MSAVQISIDFPIRKTRYLEKKDENLKNRVSLPTSPVERSQFKTPRKHQNSQAEDDSVKNSPCSPPKKPKENSKEQLSTPQTPAEMRVLRSQRQNSPLSSPKKRSPRNKENGTSCSNQRPINSPPKSIHSDRCQKPEKKFTPVRLFTPDLSLYQEAKQAFLVGSKSALYCREKEIEAITIFLKKNLIEGIPGSLYISGAPGTGKTACLNHILETTTLQKVKYDCVSINCTNLKSPQAIYERICVELCPDNEISRKRSAAADFLKCVKQKLTHSRKPILLILDEIDYLECKDQAVLYTILEWPGLENSKLILIGIANALDLTDRALPRLQVQPRCRPNLLHFTPYTKDQIFTILQQRLKEVSSEAQNVIKPVALQFCARKVASVTGDIRKALDVCRHAIELVEGETRKQQILQPRTIDDAGSPTKSKCKPKVTKCVELPLIASILNNVYGNQLTNATGQQNGGSLPLQQKILLCALHLIITNGRTKEVTLGKFHEVYSRICKKQQVSQVDQSEFTNLCNLVEARGLVCIKKNKNSRLAKISLSINEAELQYALQDKCLLASILTDSSCLSSRI